MNKKFIKICNGYVNGVDSLKRIDSVRKWFIHGSASKSCVIPILKNINLEINENEQVAFIGVNGSGKSSLLKLIAGIYTLEQGNITIEGNIAAIIEMGLGNEPELTGRENIKLLMLYNNMLDLYNKEIEQEIIEFSELGEQIDLPLKFYSSGMLARLAFSVTVFVKSDILLLDEIFAVGDSNFISKATSYMKKKISSTAITIMVSHDEKVVKENCNRAIIIDKGEIIEDCLPSEASKYYYNDISTHE